jgi:hypothetical protein
MGTISTPSATREGSSQFVEACALRRNPDAVRAVAGTHPDYEIDHLIPLCLGGADDPSNLWAQPRRSIEPTWNAEAKDRLERFMCDMVCNRQLDLATAQKAFAEDWIAAYHKYYEAH